MYKKDHTKETKASPQTVWALFKDVPGWLKWIAALEKIEMKGAFAVGSAYEFTPSGQGPTVSSIVDLKENEYFVDETKVGDIVVHVTHSVRSLGTKRSVITYSVEVTGPGEDEFGKMVSSDFPNVLEALSTLAESIEGV
jgi:hypothetical protein